MPEMNIDHTAIQAIPNIGKPGNHVVESYGHIAALLEVFSRVA